RRELRDRVVGAAELERAHALEVLALEEEARARHRVRGGRGQDRRPAGRAGDALVRGGDVGEGDREVVHTVNRRTASWSSSSPSPGDFGATRQPSSTTGMALRMPALRGTFSMR